MAVAIILAAGEGRRLGGPKALTQVAGRTMLEHVIDVCRQAILDEVFVVVGSRADEVAATARATATATAGRSAADDDGAPVTIVRNEEWDAGRTGSLQAGWRAAPETSGALVFPVDHPAVRLVTLDAMLGVFGYAAAPEILVPVIQSGPGGNRRRGHPIVLGAQVREAVLALPADARLDEFVRGRQVLEVPVDDEGILLNVNEPSDLRVAEELLAR